MHGGFREHTFRPVESRPFAQASQGSAAPLSCRRPVSARPSATAPACRAWQKSDAALAAMQLRLHDMQSCLAREHGFASWNELKDGGRAATRTGGGCDPLRRSTGPALFMGATSRSRHPSAPRTGRDSVLTEQPGLLGEDALAGLRHRRRVAKVRQAIDADASLGQPRWRPPVAFAPLIAVSHSSLVKLPGFRAGPAASACGCCSIVALTPTHRISIVGRRTRSNNRARERLTRALWRRRKTPRPGDDAHAPGGRRGWQRQRVVVPLHRRSGPCLALYPGAARGRYACRRLECVGEDSRHRPSRRL